MNQLTNRLDNLTVLGNKTTTKPFNIDLCHPIPDVYFEIINSTVPYVVNASLNAISAIIATLANILVFLAIRRSTSIRLPSKLLLSSLVLTDVAVGLILQPTYAIYLVTKANGARRISCLLRQCFGVVGSLLSFASLSLMTKISLDRYVALFFYVKYQYIVTAKRVCAILILTWSFAVVHASTFLWYTSLWYFATIGGTLTSLIAMTLTYIKIYMRLRHQHGQQVQDHAQAQTDQQARSKPSVTKYRTMAVTTLWIYVLFLICCIPLFCTLCVGSALSPAALSECISEFCYTVLLLNSCLNPFIYCFRLPDIRVEVLNTLRLHSLDDGPARQEETGR